MHTPREIADAAVEHLKAAKSRVDWPSEPQASWKAVHAIIEAACTPKAEKPAADAKPTVDAIYAIYPRKKQPRTAKVAIVRAAKRLAGEPDPLAYLLERTRLFATAVALWPEDERKQFCPYPASWFNADSFDENPKEWERGSAKVSTPRNYAQI